MLAGTAMITPRRLASCLLLACLTAPFARAEDLKIVKVDVES